MDTTDSIPIVDLLASIGQHVPIVVQNEYCKILSNWFPVMTVSRGGKTLMINIHEFFINPDTFCDLLRLPEDINTGDTEDISEVDTTTNQPEINKKHAGGRPSKHKQFPAIVTETISFLHLHGFAAKSRRRNLIANSWGVTLEDLKQHLLDNIPDLNEDGISRKTVHHLMMSPRAGTHAAKKYKGLIQARIPKKSNNQTASEHKDLHFCQSQAAIFSEAREYFHDEVIRISADDKK